MALTVWDMPRKHRTVTHTLVKVWKYILFVLVY